MARVKYRIESRWPAWARWRVVTPTPHSERYPFDKRGLYFDSLEAASKAADSLRAANTGEFRIVEAKP